MLRRRPLHQDESGQALLETALVLPLLLAVVLNAVNFAYFFIIAVNIAAAPRSAATYSIMGFSTPAGDSVGIPSATPAATTDKTVAALAYEDLHGALATYATDVSVQVCTESVLVSSSGVLSGTNGTGKSRRTNCVTCTSQTNCGSGQAVTSTSPWPGPYAPAPDPHATKGFVLHRVDVTYNFKPLIPGTPFNVALLPSGLFDSTSGKYHFRRQVSMRSMN